MDPEESEIANKIFLNPYLVCKILQNVDSLPELKNARLVNSTWKDALQSVFLQKTIVNLNLPQLSHAQLLQYIYNCGHYHHHDFKLQISYTENSIKTLILELFRIHKVKTIKISWILLSDGINEMEFVGDILHLLPSLGRLNIALECGAGHPVRNSFPFAEDRICLHQLEWLTLDLNGMEGMSDASFDLHHLVFPALQYAHLARNVTVLELLGPTCFNDMVIIQAMDDGVMPRLERLTVWGVTLSWLKFLKGRPLNQIWVPLDGFQMEGGYCNDEIRRILDVFSETLRTLKICGVEYKV
ncbi:Argininosuccinate lyase [Folsomia candida]|uniref:Argininosuccinate lyase n=2 Tax=Folsomia candida TaxID=158441 RepID=A0A226DV23_FOLCA|nr:Argininosuccinate lyase [Folsomia candida]